MREIENAQAASATTTKSRRQTIAEGCEAVIVTEAMPFVYAFGGAALRDASDQVFSAPPARYDLFAVPSLKHLMKEQAWVDLLASDIAEAMGQRGAAKALVASLSAPPRPLIQRLKDSVVLRDGAPKMKGFTLQRPRFSTDPGTLVLTCADWRLHGPDGLDGQLACAIGARNVGVFATAGGPKDLVTDGIRCQMTLSQLDLVAHKLERLLLVAHTDCDRYGGSRAFKDAGAELAALEADLAAAKARINAAFPKLKIATAIARVRGVRCLGITPVGT